MTTTIFRAYFVMCSFLAELIMSSSYCILLTSYLDTAHLNNVSMLKAFLKQKSIIFEEVDGAKPENRDLRNSLWNIAVKHGGEKNYPLVFVMRTDRTISFVGNWDRVQDLLDAESIEEEIMNDHPEIMTFTKFFSTA